VRKLILLTALFISVLVPATAHNTIYAEQYYKLYHWQLYMYPEDINENISYLLSARGSDFANPLNALAEISDKIEWERYRYLFYMHVNLELVKMYRLLASKYDKRKAFFYNEPWKETTLKSLEVAEGHYETAYHYWEEALDWSEKAWNLQYIDLKDIHYWQDQNYRIETGDLDYYDIIDMDLERLQNVREDFEAMDENTY
jgi:hypothetical protein